MHDPIAYTFGADYHCPGCTLARFGRCEGDHVYHGGIRVSLDFWAERYNGVRPRYRTTFIACTAEHFGGYTAEDSEGNPVGIVAPWDEWQQFTGECERLVCGTCLGEIDEYSDPDCPGCPVCAPGPDPYDAAVEDRMTR